MKGIVRKFVQLFVVSFLFLQVAIPAGSALAEVDTNEDSAELLKQYEALGDNELKEQVFIELFIDYVDSLSAFVDAFKKDPNNTEEINKTKDEFLFNFAHFTNVLRVVYDKYKDKEDAVLKSVQPIIELHQKLAPIANSPQELINKKDDSAYCQNVLANFDVLLPFLRSITTAFDQGATASEVEAKVQFSNDGGAIANSEKALEGKTQQEATTVKKETISESELKKLAAFVLPAQEKFNAIIAAFSEEIQSGDSASMQAKFQKIQEFNGELEQNAADLINWMQTISDSELVKKSYTGYLQMIGFTGEISSQICELAGLYAGKGVILQKEAEKNADLIAKIKALPPSLDPLSQATTTLVGTTDSAAMLVALQEGNIAGQQGFLEQFPKQAAEFQNQARSVIDALNKVKDEAVVAAEQDKLLKDAVAAEKKVSEPGMRAMKSLQKLANAFNQQTKSKQKPAIDAKQLEDFQTSVKETRDALEQNQPALTNEFIQATFTVNVYQNYSDLLTNLEEFAKQLTALSGSYKEKQDFLTRQTFKYQSLAQRILFFLQGQTGSFIKGKKDEFFSPSKQLGQKPVGRQDYWSRGWLKFHVLPKDIKTLQSIGQNVTSDYQKGTTNLQGLSKTVQSLTDELAKITKKPKVWSKAQIQKAVADRKKKFNDIRVHFKRQAESSVQAGETDSKTEVQTNQEQASSVAQKADSLKKLLIQQKENGALSDKELQNYTIWLDSVQRSSERIRQVVQGFAKAHQGRHVNLRLLKAQQEFSKQARKFAESPELTEATTQTSGFFAGLFSAEVVSAANATGDIQKQATSLEQSAVGLQTLMAILGQSGTVSRTDWMSSLSGNTLLGKMTIPGSNISASQLKADTDKYAVQTQTLDIEGQLALGVRYFDVPFNADLKLTNRSKVKFSGSAIDVMNTFEKFLAAHPSETVLVRFPKLKKEAWNKFAKEYPNYKNLFWKNENTWNNAPTLSQVQGKIVVYSDENKFKIENTRYGLYYDTGVASYYVNVQDWFFTYVGFFNKKESRTEKKWEKIENYLKKANDSDNYKRQYINNISTNEGSEIKVADVSQDYFAGELNPKVRDYVNDEEKKVNKAGIIVSDYVGTYSLKGGKPLGKNTDPADFFWLNFI